MNTFRFKSISHILILFALLTSLLGTSVFVTPAYATTLTDTTTTIVSDLPDMSAIGASVAASVTVTGADPTGTVDITGTDSDCTITLSAGAGSCNVVFNSEGVKTITATYNGDVNNNVSSDIETHWVGESASFYSSAPQDGLVLESSENSSIGGSKNYISNIIRVGDNIANKEYRGFLSFNTAGLPDTAVVLSATLNFKLAGVVGDPASGHGSLLVDIKNLYFGTSAKLVLTDFQAAASQTGVGTFPPYAPGWNSTDIDPSALAYISNISTTQFRLYFSIGDDNDLAADYLKIYSGNSTLANAPTLIIQYYVS
jgi:hypothetical protein